MIPHYTVIDIELKEKLEEPRPWPGFGHDCEGDGCPNCSSALFLNPLGVPRDPCKYPSRGNIWEFPKLGVPYFGGPYNKDPTM